MVKIFVGNCSDSSTSEDLRACFSRYGRVLEADVLDGKGFGFVHMESQTHADAAVAALDGADFKGRKLRVEISTGRSGGGGGGGGRGGGGPQRSRGGGGDRNRSFGGGDRNGQIGRSGGGRGPPRGGGGRRGGGPRDYDNHRGGRGGGNRDYDAPQSRNSYGSPRGGGGGGRSYDDPYRGGGGDYNRGGSGDYAPPARYRDASPPSYGSRDRYESRAPLPPPPVERYRPYEYGRRGPPADDIYSRGGRGASPPSAGGYYGRSRSPLPSPPRRSPPRSYGGGGGGMGAGAMGGAVNTGRYMTTVPDMYDDVRRAGQMMRGRSPPPTRGPPIRQMI